MGKYGNFLLDMFSRVLLKSRFLNAPTGTINLPQETQGNTVFGELEIRYI